MTGEEIERRLRNFDVLLPKPRQYWIETNYSQYAHAHNEKDLKMTREILAERFPDYLSTYDSYMKQSGGHRFNMLVMKQDKLDAYCTWLFDILFELERRMKENGELKARVIGYVSERLLDVWLLHNHINYGEVPILNLERENWLMKGSAFVLRKLRGERITKI